MRYYKYWEVSVIPTKEQYTGNECNINTPTSFLTVNPQEKNLLYSHMRSNGLCSIGSWQGKVKWNRHLCSHIQLLQVMFGQGTFQLQVYYTTINWNQWLCFATQLMTEVCPTKRLALSRYVLTVTLNSLFLLISVKMSMWKLGIQISILHEDSK